MLRKFRRQVLRSALVRIATVKPARALIGRAVVAMRGAGIVVLRCRRVVPDEEATLARQPGVVTASTLHTLLQEAQREMPFIHLGEAIRALSSGQPLVSPALALTFDESFAMTPACALPICKRLGIPMTVFVTTSHLDAPSTLWDEVVRLCVERAAPRPISAPWIDRSLPTQSPAARREAVHALLMALVALDEDRLNSRLETLFAATGGGSPVPGQSERMLSRSDVKQLCAEPLMSFGAHGHVHAALTSASDAHLEREMRLPHEMLQEIAGSAYIGALSYPFGRASFVDNRVFAAARAAGYRAGFTAESGIARPGDYMLGLPRVDLSSGRAGMPAVQLQGTFEIVDGLLKEIGVTPDEHSHLHG